MRLLQTLIEEEGQTERLFSPIPNTVVKRSGAPGGRWSSCRFVDRRCRAEKSLRILDEFTRGDLDILVATDLPRVVCIFRQ